MPMHPSPIAETSGPPRPSALLFIMSILTATYPGKGWTKTLPFESIARSNRRKPNSEAKSHEPAAKQDENEDRAHHGIGDSGEVADGPEFLHRRRARSGGHNRRRRPKGRDQ